MVNVMKNNHEKPLTIDDIPKGLLAHINSVITSENPEEFMPDLSQCDRKTAMMLLELTHRGKLSPSYHAYGVILMLAMLGNYKSAKKAFSSGLQFLAKEFKNDKKKSKKKK